MRNLHIVERFCDELGIELNESNLAMFTEISEYPIGIYDMFRYIRLFRQYANDKNIIIKQFLNEYSNRFSFIGSLKCITLIQTIARG